MIDLTSFCFVDNDLELLHREINQPFHRGHSTLDTDTNILVRVPRRDGDCYRQQSPWA